MDISQAVEQQILALLNAANPTVDLKPITDRLTALENKKAPPDLSLDVATLNQSASILAKRITELPIKSLQDNLKALGDRLTALPGQLHIKSVNAPNEVADTIYPLWQTWLQEGGKDGREYTALYFRSGNPNDAKLIWDKTGKIIETIDQAGNSTYTGIAGVGLKYKKTRNADQSYSFWIVQPPNSLVGNALNWIAYEANGQECDRGVIPQSDGSEDKIFPKVQTKYISLQFYWIDLNRAPEIWNIEVK